MAFKFRFDMLLKLKKINEEKLQKEFYEAARLYQESMQDLMALKEKRDAAIIRKKTMEREGRLAPEFDVIESFLKGNKHQSIQKIYEIKERRNIMDLKKQELLEASKERSIFSKLKEKAHKEYRTFLEGKEIERLDETASMYYGRKF